MRMLLTMAILLWPHRRITQHITLQGLALDRDPADGTDRPEEFAHAPDPWLLLILSAEMTTAIHQCLRSSEAHR